MFVVATWQVNVVEGPKGSCLIRNLTTHVVKNEEQAQSWLQQGTYESILFEELFAKKS